MFEIGLVLLVLGGVIGGTALVALAPWWWLFGAGLALVGLGLAVGVPAGFYYHLRLWRALRPRLELGAAFWLHPVSFHPQLTDAEKKRVMPWLYLGGAGFIVALVGCALTGFGAWRSD